MDDWRLVVRGAHELDAALEAMNKRVDRATVAGLKATQAVAKRAIRSQIKGRPRWDHRGKSGRTGDSVDLNLFPHHEARTGGPGVLTGTLKRGVGGVRRPKKHGEEFHGGVGVGGGLRNLYKGRTNQQYPYIEPGMKRAEPRFPPVWERAWGKAINRK